MSQILDIPAQNVTELISSTKHHLTKLGYKPSTILRYDAVWKDLPKYCALHGEQFLTAELGRAYVFEKFGSELGEKDSSHNVNRAIHLLLDFQKFGMVFMQSSMTLKEFSLPFKEIFESLLQDLRQKDFAENSVTCCRSRLFRFEYYLQNCNVHEFSHIELQHVNGYIESLASFSSGTISATLKLLQRLFDFALENGYHKESFSCSLPTIRKLSNYKLPTVFTVKEVECILNTIDNHNPVGKRTYAMLILIAKLGLRACDAKQLRFCNIDWESKVISIIQKKTGVALTLPLLEDVGWAIIDYLKNGRPKSDSEYIFIKHSAPFGQLHGSFNRYVCHAVRQAGIKVSAEKLIGTHSFRHSIASSMLEQGANLPEIAQMLGHVSQNSTQKYISVNVDMLRKCALEVVL